jgi:probable F420-dependent oxidoreductase
MRFGISLPQVVPDGSFDPAAFRRYVGRAEALGFDSAWTVEQILGIRPEISPLETMTYAAACSERIRLGCAIFVTSLHNPIHLAKAVSSLDQLSRGRLEIGIGAGGRFRPFAAFDADPASFVARFNEGLGLMRRLWSEERVDFDGRFWQLQGGAMEPKPFQKPHPPIWFGGNHPDGLARAVRLGDGFFGAGSQTTAAFAQQVGVVRQQLDAQQRDPATFGIAKRVYVAVDDDVERARSRIGSALQDMYALFNLPDLTPVAVYGPPTACIEGLRAVIDAGAEMIMLNPLFDEPEQMERLAAEVVPALR